MRLSVHCPSGWTRDQGSETERVVSSANQFTSPPAGSLYSDDVMTPTTYERVHETVAMIPRGFVVTYGQIARHLGMPNGARIVGWAMRRCPSHLPWHRVVSSRGGISRRGRHAADSVQKTMLKDEGVVFGSAGRIDLACFGWDGI